MAPDTRQAHVGRGAIVQLDKYLKTAKDGGSVPMDGPPLEIGLCRIDWSRNR